MNFPLVLVVITALTGLYWLVDTLVFARKRKGDEPIGVEYARQFFPVLFIVLVLRSFIFEPFRIPSGSMIPTLLVGDFILVSKFSYGVRLPVIHTKILDTGKPENGDVAVFRFPEDPKVDYIKRVIGIPGDRITLRGLHHAAQKCWVAVSTISWSTTQTAVCLFLVPNWAFVTEIWC